MAGGKAKMSLNEISFGSTVFAGSTEILRFWVGSAKATDILYSGAMYRAEEAKTLGLVQEVADAEDVIEIARKESFRKPYAGCTSIWRGLGRIASLLTRRTSTRSSSI